MGKLNGPQKAALVLMSLGQEASTLVFKNLTADEIKNLGVQMTTIRGVKKEISDEVLQEFTSKFHEEDSVYVTGDDFFRNLLPSVVDELAADDLLTAIEQAKENIPFKYVREIDPKVLANFIKSEHPQTIAVILVHLGYERAGETLGYLPEAMQFEVMNRIAQLDTVPPDLIREVDEVLERELLSISKERHQVLGGIQAVAEILNYTERRSGESILQSMEEVDSELAEKVRKLMFVFDDLAAVNDLGIRELLKEISNEELTLALKTCSDELKNKIFKNLSQRAAQMLEEDLSVLGLVRLSEVEAAQQSILNAARRLEKEGKLILAGRESGDTFV
jgi:flagellar motor switch protein FliG